MTKQEIKMFWISALVIISQPWSAALANQIVEFGWFQSFCGGHITPNGQSINSSDVLCLVRHNNEQELITKIEWTDQITRKAIILLINYFMLHNQA